MPSLAFAAAVPPHSLPKSPVVRSIGAIILLVAACGLAAAETVPLPRPRPAPAALAPPPAEEPPAPSACFLRLTPTLAVATPLPALAGAGGCGADDVVRLEAVVLPDKTQVALSPPATLRCPFAEAIARWVREDVAPAVRTLGAPLKALDNYASYDCRGRNRLVGARLSEHGKANALDMRSVRLGNGKLIAFADPHVDKDFREGLKRKTCARFATVLGPGSDGYHEDHIHVDLAERRAGWGHMCRWDVREPAAEPADAAVPLPRPRPAPG
jgi:hypothetical protein